MNDILLTRHDPELQYICDCAAELARTQLDGLFTYENALAIAEKSVAAQVRKVADAIEALDFSDCPLDMSPQTCDRGMKCEDCWHINLVAALKAAGEGK